MSCSERRFLLSLYEGSNFIRGFKVGGILFSQLMHSSVYGENRPTNSVDIRLVTRSILRSQTRTY
jgi:hypothetical protein